MRRTCACVMAAALGLGLVEVRAASPVGTVFTYQGQLLDGGAPAEGPYDFEFTLFDDPLGGSQIGSTVATDDVDVSGGVFTVQLDFGGTPFAGMAGWLEIRVRPGDGSEDYTTLSPRQGVTPTPYSIFALGAPWSGLSAVPAGFADGIDDVGGLTLPFAGSADSAETAFAVTNTGEGGGGRFLKSGGTQPALAVATSGGNTGIWALNSGGVDPDSIPVIPEDTALSAWNLGVGDAVKALNGGSGRALFAEIENTSSGADVIVATTIGTGAGLNVTTTTGNAVLATRTGDGAAAAVLASVPAGSTGPAFAGIAGGTGDGAVLESVSGRALNASITVAGNVSNVIDAATVGTGIGVNVSTTTGAAIVATRTGAGPSAAVLASVPGGSTGPAFAGIAGGTGDGAVLDSIGGRALNATISAAGNASNVIDATTAGTGVGVNVITTTGAGIVATRTGGGGAAAVLASVPAGSTGPAFAGIAGGTGDGAVLASVGGRALSATITVAGNASNVIDASTVDAGNVLNADNQGAGSAVRAKITNAANPSDVILATTAGTGRVLDATVFNEANDSEVIRADTLGTGTVVDATILNATSDADVIRASTTGLGHVLSAETDNAENEFATIHALHNAHGDVVEAVSTGNGGVAGLTGSAVKAIILGPGNEAPAIAAATVGDGPAVSATTTGPNMAGVFEITNGDVTGNDNPALKGITNSDSGIGVSGVASAASGFTTGVSGIAASADGAGVFGLGGAAGVWGDVTEEVNENAGVLGTNGSTVDLSAGVRGDATGDNGIVFGVKGLNINSPDGIGVFGVSLSTSGYSHGVYGKSNSVDPDAAGVTAEGAGSDFGAPRAAALHIRSGAIRVSGPGNSDVGPHKRPAGTKVVLIPAGEWAPLDSCFAQPGGYDDLTHSHITGFGADVFFQNDLIVADSIILATIETESNPLHVSYWVQVHTKVPGSCYFRVTQFSTNTDPFTCLPEDVEVGIHYLIINPALTE